jgi:hypothetical protein
VLALIRALLVGSGTPWLGCDVCEVVSNDISLSISFSLVSLSLSSSLALPLGRFRDPVAEVRSSTAAQLQRVLSRLDQLKVAIRVDALSLARARTVAPVIALFLAKEKNCSHVCGGPLTRSQDRLSLACDRLQGVDALLYGPLFHALS